MPAHGKRSLNSTRWIPIPKHVSDRRNHPRSGKIAGPLSKTSSVPAGFHAKTGVRKDFFQSASKQVTAPGWDAPGIRSLFPGFLHVLPSEPLKPGPIPERPLKTEGWRENRMGKKRKSACNLRTKAGFGMNFLSDAKALEAQMRALFEELHRDPEPPHQEIRTHARVRRDPEPGRHRAAHAG